MSGKTNLKSQRKYVPNLPAWLSVCEANYVRLLKLLPDCDSEDLSYHFGIGKLSYFIRILECTPYTSTLELKQQADHLPDYLRPQMQVRLYHDARMAEVLSCKHITQLQASYEYPNAGMLQKNEKEMVNQFLCEWLNFCLQHMDTTTEC